MCILCLWFSYSFGFVVHKLTYVRAMFFPFSLYSVCCNFCVMVLFLLFILPHMRVSGGHKQNVVIYLKRSYFFKAKTSMQYLPFMAVRITIITCNVLIWENIDILPPKQKNNNFPWIGNGIILCAGICHNKTFMVYNLIFACLKVQTEDKFERKHSHIHEHVNKWVNCFLVFSHMLFGFV